VPSFLDLTASAVAAQALGVPVGDAQLQRLITASSAAIAQWLGYPVHRRVVVDESVAASGGPTLFLRAGAVQSLQAVKVGGAEVPAANYRIDSAIRGRVVGRGWPFTGASSGGISSTPLHTYDTGEVTVSYTSGWVTPGQAADDPGTYPTVDLPGDIEQACLELVVAWYRRRGRDGDVASVSLGGGSFSYANKQAVPVTARTLLAPYRKRLG
jgi:hypothetical protein